MVSFAWVALPLFENAQMKKRIECQKNWPFNFFKASIIWSSDLRIQCMLILMMIEMKSKSTDDLCNERNNILWIIFVFIQSMIEAHGTGEVKEI